MKILCKILPHKWGKSKLLFQRFGTECKRCGTFKQADPKTARPYVIWLLQYMENQRHQRPRLWMPLDAAIRTLAAEQSAMSDEALTAIATDLGWRP